MTYHSLAPKNLRKVWEKSSVLLDVLEDSPDDIVALIKHCSAADLHGFNKVHGLPQEIKIFEAILTHPMCDRSTALNIFNACDPQFYEHQFAHGATACDFDDPQDQTFLAILDLVHGHLCSRPDWRAQFPCEAQAEWELFPTRRPDRFKTWPLPAAVLTPPEDRPIDAMITYCFSTIHLSYHAWALRQ